MCSTCGPGHSDEECPKKRTEVGVEMAESPRSFDPELLKGEEWLDFFIAFQQNQGVNPGSEQKIAQRMLEHARDFNGEQFFYGIRDKTGRLAVTGKLEISLNNEGEKEAGLSSLTVAREYRGKKFDGEKLSKKITDARIAKAKEEGCKHVKTDVFSANPSVVEALAVKLNDGYRVEGFEIYPPRKGANEEMGRYLLKKRIDSEPDVTLSAEQIEVPLKEFQAIIDATGSGWVGTEVKNNTLVLRRKE